MFTNATATTTATAMPGLGRRSMLGRSLLSMLMLAAVPLAAAPLSAPAHADEAANTPSAGAVAAIQQFNTALLATMKAGGRTDFGQRFQALAPAVDQAFDLPVVLSVSVGLDWSSLSPDQQARLLAAFRRYTVASYVANFDSYAGQSFSVSPDTRDLGAGRVVVQTRIVPVSGSATELDYVMLQTPSGWKVVDVLAAGSISRVAVQRSDFRHLLTRGGGDALVSSLQRKTTDLSGGALA